MANLFEAAKQQIGELTLAAYAAAVKKGLLPDGAEMAGSVEIAREQSMGDWATSCAMAAAKQLKTAPRKIAEVLVSELNLSGSFFESAEAAGPGFINFRLSDKWYAEVLSAIETEGDRFGCVDAGSGRIMVEFVSANPTGTMTIGNARGGVLGDTMSEVLSRAGFDVWREFYVNDAGHQVELFTKSLEARYIQLILGEDAAEFPEDGYHGEDIKDLAKELYGKFGKSLLDVSQEERREKMREYGIERNVEKMRTDLLRYGIEYDCWFRESSLHESGYVKETVSALVGAGRCYEKDGALWLRLTDFGAEKDEVLLRSDGSYTYFAVDLAYHRNKFIERDFDKVINVLGADHHGHALRFRKAMPALDIDPERLDFILMQLVLLVRNGETVKVSKRTGKAISLSDLLDEISCDAARFFFNAKPNTHLEFDLDLAVRQDSENPVYYVQYAHARICSLMKALAEEGEAVRPVSEIDISLLSEYAERELIKQLAQLPEEIKLAARDYDPSRINRYLVELAARFHRFYNSGRIKGAPPELLAARLKLADSARRVLAIGLGILGVSAPEKM
ncbi:MAG: arginine--tRNA ligase [Clostridiales bacterium]|nr:arginine--tRNA ligase [Clostridiales bacterium]